MRTHHPGAWVRFHILNLPFVDLAILRRQEVGAHSALLGKPLSTGSGDGRAIATDLGLETLIPLGLLSEELGNATGDCS
jgi:hypothetical protein